MVGVCGGGSSIGGGDGGGGGVGGVGMAVITRTVCFLFVERLGLGLVPPTQP